MFAPPFLVSGFRPNVSNQLEQDFEIATNEYEYINNALKQDLPRFMQLATHFIDPLFNSFYYMQYVSTLWRNQP
jgi:hypothetical protein